jgi:phosphate transport system substrate-binding protein
MKRKTIGFLLCACIFAGPAFSAGKSENITVISREEGSGTRSAFIELFGVLEGNTDSTTAGAEITNNTAVMMTSVAGNKNAVGYISLGSLNSTVKALRINGVEATPANVANGSYVISRPFYIAVNGATNAQSQDFINFIMSRDGQDLIEKNGYIRVGDTGSFSSARVSGKIVVAGSSSVTPIMEKLKEAYLVINSGLNIEIQQSDSSTGMNAAISGICDIGMASRELKDSETRSGLKGTIIAMDGIAVIVNRENPSADLKKEQVRDIFTGKLVSWEKLEG